MSTASAIQLTAAERPLYAHFFALADPQSSGMISGSSAVSFFALSGLPNPVLGSIWTIADADNNGFLGPAQFSAALRLIGHAQNGKVVTEDLVRESGPAPTFKGINVPPHLTGNAAANPSRSSSMIIPQGTGSGGYGTSDIKPEDRARYTRIFASAGPQGGLLDGEKAKEIFVKSKLPFDKLGAIWNLADTKSRGKLDLTDFIIGMHFIQSTMNGTLTTIPASLPAGLYEKATGGSGTIPQSPSGITPLGAQNTGGSTGYLSRQMTGANQFSAPNTPLRSNIRSPPPSSTASNFLQSQRTGSTFAASNAAASTWAVTPTDKAKSDRFFDGLDQDRQGVLEGQAAVPFFMQSGLNEVTLAHIWDLSDITQSGSLSKDEFAVAMHLINLKITGSDLPQELPSSLVPPNLRGTNLPQAVNPAETDTQRDLFSLMDDDAELPVSTASAFAAPLSSTNTGQAKSAPKVTPGPFDDDFLGSGTGAAPAILSPTITGASTMGAAKTFTPQATGGEFNARSATQMPFGDASAEVGNQRLALDSTEKSLSTLETKKADLQKSVANDASQIQDLTTRLETVRMRHQTESEAVKALNERHAAQVLELKKLREESVREESELSRLREEKDEVEQSLMKDREDVREMKRVVGEKTKLKEELKVELEKLKKDARMQKGLVAIGKKQLSQAETDVTGVQGELDQVKAGNALEEEQQLHAEHGEVAMSPRGESTGLTREMTGASTVMSPAASVRSNNPFDRLPTHAGGAAAAGAAAAGLASAVGIGAAVAHHDERSTDTAAGEPSGNDPFSVRNTIQGDTPTNVHSVGAASEVDPSSAFDDSFANFDSATAAGNVESSAPRGPIQGSSAFDDAFADLDAPGAAAAAAASETAVPIIPGSFEAAGPDATAGDTIVPPEAESIDEAAHVRAPTADEVKSDADVVGITPSAEKGKSAAITPDEEEENDEIESSDEEEEEPEDVDQPTARRMVDSPDELGEGKGTRLNTAAIPLSMPAESAAQAANRFPELDEVDPSTTAKAPISPNDALGKSSSTFAPTSSSSIVSPIPAAVSMGRTPSAPNSDAFHDAYSDAHSNKGETGAVDGGFVAVTSHERYTTALDNEDASVPSTSTSKTRRAPPPAPSRGSTLASPPIPTNLGPFANLTSANNALNKDAGLDDFDAAFEDLGPTGNGTTENTSNSSSMPGFEDAFGDADDFDFVPSFHDASSNLPPTSAPSNIATSKSEGFDGFDSAFDSAFDTGANKGGGTANNAASNTSGFSFEDAFAPLETNANTTSAAAAAAAPVAAPPSLPSRAPTSNTSAPPPSQSTTGALPDDAAPVRQLCAMGFSRSDVIKSLERSNYRTDKALEKLLAQA